MLLGQYEANLTEKGRLAVPKKFREKLGVSIIAARWYEGCLVLVGTDKWKELLSRLTSKSDIITAPVRDTDRFILGSAFEIDLDKQGRFVVPKLLKDYAGLKSESVFVGLGDRIEIWDKVRWAEKEVLISKKAEQLVEELARTVPSNK